MTGQISADADVGTLAGSEMIPVVASGVNKRTSPSELATYIGTALKGQFPATATNDSASAGNVGEFASSTKTAASAIALTSNAAADVTTIALGAGDWDVWGVAVFTFGASTTATLLLSSIAMVANTPGSLESGAAVEQAFASFHPGGDYSVPCLPQRISLGAPATIHLVAAAAFATSTCAAYGSLYARRAR